MHLQALCLLQMMVLTVSRQSRWYKLPAIALPPCARQHAFIKTRWPQTYGRRSGLSARSLEPAGHTRPPRAQKIRLGHGAETASAKAQLQAEWNDSTAKLARLDAEISRRHAEIGTVKEMVAKLEQTVPLSRQREDDFKKLVDQGFVASHTGQDRARERIELERDLATPKSKAGRSKGHAARKRKRQNGLLRRNTQNTVRPPDPAGWGESLRER